ncbi:pantoate--beta-alanine ligase [Hydrogenophaga sp. 5NK40-0174]|uniref:pantoate--beta-alanine ligase n=1 Tax=Hydrogenophaga sp. 5NK40-0174 TaxID=3127649 RepID=UPI0031025197
MKVVHTIADLRAALAPFSSPSFVPTMGNLHEGHLHLMSTARGLGDVRVASIFVNRLQFAPHEDFDTYPRTLEADCAKLEAEGCDVVFAPSEKELYPQKQGFLVQPPESLANILEGHFRPGFFTGVCSVVSKLFNCVFAEAKGERFAVFGKKDYQQQMVLRQMVHQLNMGITIVGGETQRTVDGLALSSRNSYLSDDERKEALHLSLTLRDLARDALSAGGALPGTLAGLEERAMAALTARGWAPDYLTVRRRSDLQLPDANDAIKPASLVVLGAARLGTTRLIDNMEI